MHGINLDQAAKLAGSLEEHSHKIGRTQQPQTEQPGLDFVGTADTHRSGFRHSSIGKRIAQVLRCEVAYFLAGG